MVTLHLVFDLSLTHPFSPPTSPAVPCPTTLQVSVGPEDPAIVVATLRRNLDLLQTLASERAAMEEAIKEQKKKDNIMPKLMATPPQVGSSRFGRRGRGEGRRRQGKVVWEGGMGRRQGSHGGGDQRAEEEGQHHAQAQEGRVKGIRRWQEERIRREGMEAARGKRMASYDLPTVTICLSAFARLP